jgi:N-methylhydantoinase B
MDAVSTEIMKNRFTAMAEEAATVAYRTAHTTFVKQTQDFQVALASLDGSFFAYPVMTGVTSGSGQTVAGLIDAFPREAYRRGDVLISNDPFRTWGLVTHTMDIHLARPIFVGDELVCFAWSFVHASDIGGAAPGSISPDLYEVYQEGIRLRPTFAVREGVVNKDVMNALHDNSRIGDAVWGDLEAMMAAMRLLDDRVNELCAKTGVAAFHQGIDDVMAYAEAKARSVISGLKDGTYTFCDYLEADAEDDAIMIHCRLTISGDEAEIDYAGSSPQVHAAMNFTTGGRTHPFLCLGLTNYIQTVEPTVPINGGIIRPIRAHAPPGTIMNAELPAAMGNRWVAVMRTYDALIGCLNQAISGGIAACGAGQAGIISTTWVEAETGLSRVAVVEPFSGGSGGRVRTDGVHATDTMIGYLKSTPIEHVEVETPLIVREHALEPERIGHGRYRGGAAVRIALQCRAPEAKVTVRGLDRFLFQPWGVFGGAPGHAGETWLNPDGPNPEALGRIKVLTMKEGDLLRMISPSGGGFGNPRLRDPELVLADVRDGLIGVGTARDVYRVVIGPNGVDQEGTAELRGENGSVEAFLISQGPARLNYERRWPVASTLALTERLMAIPAGLRRFVRERARATLRMNSPSPTAEQASAAVLAEALRLGANVGSPDG